MAISIYKSANVKIKIKNMIDFLRTHFLKKNVKKFQIPLIVFLKNLYA